MNTYVTDTHALYWHLTDSPRLGTQASHAFDEADQGLARVCISVVVLAELYYLNETLGRPLVFAAEVQRLRASSQFVLVPLLPDDISDFDADRAVPEMHDRILTGVARRIGAALITRDPQIVNAGRVTTIW